MRLPSMTPKELIRALERANFVGRRQVGSHLSLEHTNGTTVVVPMHHREMKRGLLLGIIKDAGFTQQEFMEFL